MTNDRPVYSLPLVNYNVYWPIIGHLYCMTLFYKLFQGSVKLKLKNILIFKGNLKNMRSSRIPITKKGFERKTYLKVIS